MTGALAELPPKVRLERAMAQVVAVLGGPEFEDLIRSPALAGLSSAVASLGSASARSAAAAALDDAEAAWLAEQLTERFRRISDAPWPPAIAIVGPSEVWLGDRPRTVELGLAGAGIEALGSVAWTGAARDHAGPRIALEVPADAEGEVRSGVRAEVRTATGREVLVAEHRLRVRRPVVAVDETRTRLVVRDRDGLPGAGVAVVVGDRRLRTGNGGLVVLAAPLADGATIDVGGVGLPWRAR